MPIRVRYDIHNGAHKAPMFITYDRRLAVIERDELIRRGKGIYRIQKTVIPDNMNKSEQYLYIVYDVRQLQRKYFNGGRDKTVFKQALEKEKELDDWNARISRYLSTHPEYKPADPKAHYFFTLVSQWRKFWKEYFAYKKGTNADPAVVRERAKQCRDYEIWIDNYIKQAIGL